MAKKLAAKKFPKTVYIRWDGDDESQYLDATDDMNKHADVVDAERTVGVYELVRVAKVKTTTELV